MVFETYKRQHAFIVLFERLAERQALLAAFTLLDTNGNKRLSKKEFSRLVMEVRPETSSSTVDLTFNLLDSDQSESIDSHEFIEAASALMARSHACPLLPGGSTLHASHSALLCLKGSEAIAS